MEYWGHVGINPFSPERTALTKFDPSTVHEANPNPPAAPTTTPKTGGPTKPSSGLNTRSLGTALDLLAPIHPGSRGLIDEDDVPEHMTKPLPDFLTPEYIEFCELQQFALPKSCCPVDLFQHMEAQTLGEIGCQSMVIPETMMGSRYYNPLFLNEEERKRVVETGDITALRGIYLEAKGLARGKRQIGLAIAGGSMFGFAVNSILNFFGYSTHTSAEVKHINANQQHLNQIEKHVEQTELFAKKMRAEAHSLANKEQMIERFLHISTALGGIFENYELLMQGLDTLFQHKQISPLLINRKELMAEMRAMQHKERALGNVLLIEPQSVWSCKVSYVVTRHLDILIVVHVPVSRAESYRHLYRYVATPLAFSESDRHFFPNPKDKHLLLDNDNGNPRSMSPDDFLKCEVVKEGVRFCPAMSYQLNESPPSCLKSLHQGDSVGVLSFCPVSLVDEQFVYVANLGFGKYSVYSKDEIKVRVFCSSNSVEALSLTGLSQVEIRKDCRVVGEMFVLEPVVDFQSTNLVLDSIPVTFEKDQNFTSAMEWGRRVGLLSDMPDSTGETMADVAKSWDSTLLVEQKHTSLVTMLIYSAIAVVSALALTCFFKECWGCYSRRRMARGLANTISSQVQSQVREHLEMRPMLPAAGEGSGRAYPHLPPSAPTVPVSGSN